MSVMSVGVLSCAFVASEVCWQALCARAVVRSRSKERQEEKEKRVRFVPSPTVDLLERMD